LQDIEYTLRSLLINIDRIRYIVMECDEDENIIDRWNCVCYRFDIVGLVIFEFLNLCLLFWWLSFE
jgi:hypothetical protein